MESGTFSTEEFKAFGSDVVLFLHVTSYVEGEPYAELLQEKGGRGFPYLAALDAEGNVVTQHNGPRSVEGFQTTMKGAATWLSLKDKADLTKDEVVDLLLARIGIGKADFEEAREAVAAMKDLSEAQKAKIDDALMPLEIQSHMPRGRGGSPDAVAKAGKAFSEMMKAGREPSASSGRMGEFFYFYMMAYAEAEKDVETFEKAFGKLESMLKGKPRTESFIEQQRARLDKLKASIEEGEEDDEDDDGMGGGG